MVNEVNDEELKTKFIKYAQDTYPRAVAELKSHLDKTDYAVFHALALKFMFVVEHGVVKFPPEEHFRQIMSKMSHELIAFVWCLSGGSLHGCFHHIRSMMEITAITNYFFAKGDKNKQDRRLRKFSEFANLAKYQFYTELKTKFDKGTITKQQFDEENIIMPRDIATFTDDKINEWQKLWEPKNNDVMQIKNWHHPATIDNLVEQAEPEYRRIYHQICHVVHVSPMSKGLVGANLILQKEQIYKSEEYVQLASNFVHKFLRILDKWTELDFSSHFSSVFMQFSHLKHVAEKVDTNRT